MILLPIVGRELRVASMWHAMRNTTTRRAAGAALAQILILPWLIFGMFSGPAQYVNAGFWVYLSCWLFLNLGLDLVQALWARYSLLAHFREWAAPQTEHSGLFAKFGRILGTLWSGARKLRPAPGR